VVTVVWPSILVVVMVVMLLVLGSKISEVSSVCAGGADFAQVLSHRT